MAMSGMKCDENCKTEFSKMKIKSPYRYLILKVGETSVVLDKKGDSTKNFEDLKNDLNQNEPRYIIYDMKDTNNKGKNQKLILISYIPLTDGSSLTQEQRKKMLTMKTVHGATLETVKKLDGSFSGNDYRADGMGELDEIIKSLNSQ